jgi:uncharacterized membrane protein YdjX (TVP38/TMEM64 family)
MIDSILEWLRSGSPWMFVAAMGVLPLVGVPLSALWVLTGATFGRWTGLGLIIAGMAINFALAYVISNRLLREPIARLLERRGIQVPEAHPGEYIKLTIAARVFPGLPNFMQSYLLGLANVPFRIYYPVSFPPQILYALGFVLFGDSLVKGKTGSVILAISVVVAAGLLANIARRRYRVEEDKRGE